MGYFKDNIEAMTAYAPGEQPRAEDRTIKLNTNENPLPPSPRAMAVLRELREHRLRLYPDPMARDFAREAAGVLGVPEEWIVPGNGSDDLIVMIARACAGPGRAVAYPTPTFPFYLAQTQIEDAERIEIPLEADWTLPVEELAAADAAVTFVANPNTPTGVSTSAEALGELAGRLDGLLVVDEAYVDFAEGDCLRLVRDRKNVIILRTLSKGYSLAGLRLGFAIAQPSVGRQLLKTKAIYNTGAIPCAVGAAAIADQEHHRRCVEQVKANRAALATALQGIGFTVVPSQANFLLVRPPDGQGQRLYEQLKSRKILVRYFSRPRLTEWVRITVGTREQHQRLLSALSELLGGS